MKPILTDDDRTKLDQRITETEKHTKTQIVLATVERCDTYAEIPWKAFALGTSVSGLLVFLLNLLLSVWLPYSMIFASIAATMATGAFSALLTFVLPGFARLFLSVHRAKTETQQYAKSLFLERELFLTEKRSGILLLVSHFERQVVILPDKGLNNQLNADVLQDIIAQMSRHLAQNAVRLAMEAGLEGLIKVLEHSVSTKPEKDELSNEIIEREGV
jgi:putative membrane protein